MANTKLKGKDILDGSIGAVDTDFSDAADRGSLITTDIFYVAAAATPAVLKKTTLSAIQASAWAAQNKNKVFAGPTTGSDAAPAFRVLVKEDLPGEAVLNDGATSKVTTIVVTTEANKGSNATTLYICTS